MISTKLQLPRLPSQIRHALVNVIGTTFIGDEFTTRLLLDCRPFLALLGPEPDITLYQEVLVCTSSYSERSLGTVSLNIKFAGRFL